jgi:superfamily II DNA helicase RecQ
LANWTLKGIRQEIAQLEDQGLLTPFEKDGYRLLRLSPAGQDWLNAHPRDIAAVTATQPSKVAMETVPRSGHRSDDLSDYDRTLFERLRAWRLDQARQMGKPPFIILQDKVLKRIASSCPATEQDLAQIKGIGPRKLEQYASAVLDIVASLREDPSKEET